MFQYCFSNLGSIGSSSKSQTGANSTNIEDTYRSIKQEAMKKSSNQSSSRNKHQQQQNKSSDINIQIFKNNEKISASRKKLVKLKESLKRNPG